MAHQPTLRSWSAAAPRASCPRSGQSACGDWPFCLGTPALCARLLCPLFGRGTHGAGAGGRPCCPSQLRSPWPRASTGRTSGGGLWRPSACRLRQSESLSIATRRPSSKRMRLRPKRRSGSAVPFEHSSSAFCRLFYALSCRSLIQTRTTR